MESEKRKYERAEIHVYDLLKQIETGTLEFKGLPESVKIEMVGFLKCEGILGIELSKKLNCAGSTISLLWGKFEEKMAAMVRQSAPHFIGRLVAKAEHLYKSARADGDWKTCWTIETDLIDRLIKMGLVDHAPEKVNISYGESADKLRDQLNSDLAVLERLKARQSIVANGTNGHPAN